MAGGVKSRSHPLTYRGYWHDADLRKGDVIRKESGTRGFRVRDIQGSYIQVRNTMNDRLDTWDRWQQIYVVSWNDEDHCTEHGEYAAWCDNCVEAKRVCTFESTDRCGRGHLLNRHRLCQTCEACSAHVDHDPRCPGCIARYPAPPVSASPSATTTADKDIMFTTTTVKVLGGEAGQVIATLKGEPTVLWQSEPQVGVKKDADDVKTTAKERAQALADEKLHAVLSEMFA